MVGVSKFTMGIFVMLFCCFAVMLWAVKLWCCDTVLLWCCGVVIRCCSDAVLGLLILFSLSQNAIIYQSYLILEGSGVYYLV
jgi:hypothetical protein